MAKVYGQDIPSKHFDTYHNFFARSYGQRHQPYGNTVKRSNWDFPGYPFHPHFPSPAQLYVRAIFKSATICWHLQPDEGGAEKPISGPIPKEWWENEADKDRTFGYRKFMRDTLLQKFRVGDPTWCVPVFIPFAFNYNREPDTAFYETLYMATTRFYGMPERWFRNIMIERPPSEVGKPYLWLKAYELRLDDDQTTYVDAIAPYSFDFVPSLYTWNNQPSNWWNLDRLNVGALGWYRFFVADFRHISIQIYFDDVQVPQISPQGSISFHSPLWGILEDRPFFALE